jgi:transcriptional antiterminator NusG
METQEHQYYIVRAALGKEEKFLENVAKVLSKKEDHGIYSMFAPDSVKGYVFFEGDSLQKVVDAVRGVPGSKGVIREPVSFEELEKYFEKEGEKIIVHERDIVEMIAGPFKGDKAKVVRVVPGKDEVIIEPLNMAVPIPITLSLDDIRVIESGDAAKEEE